MTVEDLLNHCGGFGKYQLFIILSVSSHKLTTGWSMLQMSFAGFIPDWHCELGRLAENVTLYANETLNKCSLNTSLSGHSENCQTYRFDDKYRTVISEWDIVCDAKWIKATITSIQMVGVFVGAISMGQLSDLFGRKKTLFSYSLLHALLNIGAAFSTSWEVFAAFRFFIGIGIGGIMVVTFPYPMEFLPVRWRPILIIFPVWLVSVSIFSLVAFLVNDWFYLHIGCGLFGLLPLLGYPFTPESVRWLAITGRHTEAGEIYEKMARTNGKTTPSNMKAVLQKIYEDEKALKSSAGNYSYLHLFKGGRQIKISIISAYQWMILSMTYYGISFGVSALAGNLFLNIFLLGIVELPGLLSTFYFNNKFGRKPTTLTAFTVSLLASIGCLVSQLALTKSSRGTYITALSLVAKMGVATAWGVLQVWCSELHPTVVRNLAYGYVSSASRIGGVLAPFVLDLDVRQMESYIIMVVMLLVATVLCFFVPETRGKELSDSFDPASASNRKSTKTPINAVVCNIDKDKGFNSTEMKYPYVDNIGYTADEDDKVIKTKL